MLDQLFDKLRNRYGMGFPVVDLLYSKPFAAYANDIVSAVYVGKRTIDGMAAHHLSVESSSSDWQIWVRDGNAPVPLRLAVTYVLHAERPGFITILSNWKMDAKPSAGQFTFHAPSGAKKVTLLKKVKK